VVEVIATDEWLAWYDGLDEQADDAMTGDERFYDRMIPIAERIWEHYKRERGSK
jgi:hypothetical protein